MANIIKHVRRRSNGVFYYERRVPQKVIDLPVAFDALFGGRRLFRTSLGTKVQTQAMEKAIATAGVFEARVRDALGGGNRSSTKVPLPAREVTDLVLAKITMAQRNTVARSFRVQQTAREMSSEANDEYERMIDEFEQEAMHVKDVCLRLVKPHHPKFDVEQAAANFVEIENLDALENSQARGEIVSAVRRGMLAGYTDVSDMIRGNTTSNVAAAPRSQSKAPLISAVVNSYVSRQGKRRTISEVKGALAAFLTSVGDLPLDEVDRSHFQRFCGDEGRKDIGVKSSQSVQRPMSAATIRKKVALLKAAINEAIDRGEYEGTNPASRLNPSAFTRPVPRSTMPRKRPFKVDELNQLFAYPWFTGCKSASATHEPGEHRLSGMHYWAPILALFTGCRAGELGGLMLNEVSEQGSFPHLRIQDNRFRSTKGGYSRSVPLLDQLMDLGFGTFVDSARKRGQVRLFEDWKPPAGRVSSDDPAWSNGAIIRSFNQTVMPKVFTDGIRGHMRRDLTFHSFRGAFKTMLGLQKHRIQVNYVHEVVGHAKLALDERYVGEIPLEETYPAVRGCRFAGLSVPLLPP